MAGIPDKTIIFRKFDLWWPLLTSIFTWAKKWPKWLRTGSLSAVDRCIVGPSSFPSFRVRGRGHFGPPPPPPWRRWLRPPPGRGLRSWCLHHRVSLVKARRNMYSMILKEKVNFKIWPQVKVTWWPKLTETGHIAHHLMRLGVANTMSSFSCLYLFSIKSYKQKMVTLGDLKWPLSG